MGTNNNQTVGQSTQQHQNVEIQNQDYQPNLNYQLPKVTGPVWDSNYKERVRYSDEGTLIQDPKLLPINQKFYEITGRTEEPNEMHRLSMRLAELKREKVRNRRQTITCYNCGKTGHTKGNR